MQLATQTHVFNQRMLSTAGDAEGVSVQALQTGVPGSRPFPVQAGFRCWKPFLLQVASSGQLRVALCLCLQPLVPLQCGPLPYQQPHALNMLNDPVVGLGLECGLTACIPGSTMLPLGTRLEAVSGRKYDVLNRTSHKAEAIPLHVHCHMSHRPPPRRKFLLRYA